MDRVLRSSGSRDASFLLGVLCRDSNIFPLSPVSSTFLMDISARWHIYCMRQHPWIEIKKQSWPCYIHLILKVPDFRQWHYEWRRMNIFFCTGSINKDWTSTMSGELTICVQALFLCGEVEKGRCRWGNGQRHGMRHIQQSGFRQRRGDLSSNLANSR